MIRDESSKIVLRINKSNLAFNFSSIQIFQANNQLIIGFYFNCSAKLTILIGQCLFMPQKLSFYNWQTGSRFILFQRIFPIRFRRCRFTGVVVFWHKSICPAISYLNSHLLVVLMAE